MIRQHSSTPSWRVKRRAVADERGVEQDLVGRRPLAALLGELQVELDRARRPSASARWACTRNWNPVLGSSLTTTWFGSISVAAAKPSRGGCLKTSRSSVCVTGRRLPVRMKNGTPGPAPVLDLEPQRGVGLGRRVRRDAVDRAVAVVLAADVVRRVGLADRVEERDLRVLERLRRRRATGGSIAAAATTCIRWLTTTSRSAPTGIVEVAAVLDPEVLGHRDLDGRDVVAVPDRLEHRVREAQVEDLVEAHLPEVVVDAVELRLVDVLVQLVGERAGRLEVVPERLLDDDARALRCRPASRSPLTTRPNRNGGISR